MATSTKENNGSNNGGGDTLSTMFEEIIALAKECGYDQSRPSVSATLFFIEQSPAFDMPPVRINVYPTTRSIMTHLNHPSSVVCQ